MTPALEVSDLAVALGDRAVLESVNLCLPAGEFVGLIGPNGAGKSTLMRALDGSQPRRRGWVRIAGHDLARSPLAARRALGVAVDPAVLPGLPSARQCLELVAGLRGETSAVPAALRLSEALGLAPWIDRPVHTYSLGTRQKLAIVLALIGAPRLILLDEVLNGLDPLATWALKQTLRERVEAGATVLLATHGLEVAERFLDRALLLLDGRIAADWDRDALAAFRADPSGGLEHAVVEHLRARRPCG